MSPAKEKRMSLLMHPLRRNIYKLICESPGAYFFELASELSAPHGTLSWHLKMLGRAGLIQTMKFGGKRIYYPKVLRSAQAETAYVALKSGTARNIFEYITNNEGCHQLEIAESLGIHHDTVRWHASKLRKAGLIDVMREGRRIRYYVGEIGQNLLEGALNLITESFIRFLCEKLEEDCLHPEVTEKDRNHVTIRIQCPRSQDIELSINLETWSFSEDEDEDGDDGDIEEEEEEEVETLVSQ
ncbi:helix-turn-helix domain-containing protein [Candidatus Borrarchaeum sp.]|uniref:winged helix-turn-helix transcriptional regulator n=1 Tax=Candidatus Borrarchaeum sp. TaxID=2846742 RepID=UPI00257B5EAD|nr:helix-turn-helix domain-containing protein [Candidatus Borrarchaeum sp.]